MNDGEKAHHIMYLDINQCLKRVPFSLYDYMYTPPHFSSLAPSLPIYLSVNFRPQRRGPILLFM